MKTTKALLICLFIFSISACTAPASKDASESTATGEESCLTCGDGTSESRAASDIRKVYPEMWYDAKNCSVENTPDPRAQGLIATFAAMSSTVYLNKEKAESCESKNVNYKKDKDCVENYVPIPPGWRYLDQKVDEATGLVLSIFQRNDKQYGKPITVFVIRGTEPTKAKDWWNDFNPIIWKTPPQYTSARNKVVDWLADKRSPYLQGCGADMDLYITGHSLGGGIAQYIAYRHPCMTAVAFNSIGRTERRNIPNEEYMNPAVCRVAESYEPARVLTRVSVPLPLESTLHSCTYPNNLRGSAAVASHSIKTLSEQILCRAVATGKLENAKDFKTKLAPEIRECPSEMKYLSGVWCK